MIKGNLLNFKIPSFIETKSKQEFNDILTRVILINKNALKETSLTFDEKFPKWQQKSIAEGKKIVFAGESGPTIVKVVNFEQEEANYSLTHNSPYAIAREAVSDVTNEMVQNKASKNIIEFYGFENTAISGAIVGIELSLYRFEKSLELGELEFKKEGKKLSQSIIQKAINIGIGVNQARHLVNLPPNQLNPVSYAKEIQKTFKNSKTTKVTILDEKKLEKEGCGLLLSVGMSSDNPPRIVKLEYRNAAKSTKPIAMVGKGLTFDSGGLDIKPAAGMRLMKKDMGGSATLMGIARWLEEEKPKKNIDILLALAENAISEKASRPSDIFTAKNGLKVEIHNTDAEGRLAMSDTITTALEAQPSMLIDVATLTGAGKVALGQDIASLFTNDDELADKLLKSGQEAGDLAWRMPLYQPYFKGLNSDFADMQNAASGHGGAITAALFLEKFVEKTKWAHFDIFGWTSGAKPSLVQKGGSGQGVELLIHFLK